MIRRIITQVIESPKHSVEMSQKLWQIVF